MIDPFAFAPLWASLAAMNWARIIAQDDVTEGLPIPASFSSWGQFIFGTGGPLAIGWFWYRKYNQTVRERSEFLATEVDSNRLEITTLKAARAVLSEDLFASRSEHQVTKLALNRALIDNRYLTEENTRMAKALESAGVVTGRDYWLDYLHQSNKPQGEKDDSGNDLPNP